VAQQRAHIGNATGFPRSRSAEPYETYVSQGSRDLPRGAHNLGMVLDRVGRNVEPVSEWKPLRFSLR
jgi:hypothetical protein